MYLIVRVLSFINERNDTREVSLFFLARELNVEKIGTRSLFSQMYKITTVLNNNK
jgi:hypothetical protein